MVPFSSTKNQIGDKLVRYAHPDAIGRMLEYWNDGIMGSGKCVNIVMVKFILTKKEREGDRETDFLIPAECFCFSGFYDIKNPGPRS